MAYNIYKSFEEQSLTGLLKRSVELYGNNPIALIKKDDCIKSISYNDFFSEVCIGASKIEASVGKENNIAICGKFDYAFMLSFFQIIFSGNTVVPIDMQQSDEMLKKSIEKVDIHYYLSSTMERNILTDMAEKICLKDNNVSINYEDYKKRETASEAIALIIFTSGTESEPKAVALTHKNIVSNVFYSMKIMGLETFSQDDHIVSVLPAFHMFQIVTGFLAPIGFGVANCFVLKESELLKSFRIFEPKVLIAVPEILKSLKKMISGSMKNNYRILLGDKLKLIVCGGAFCGVDVLQWYDLIGLTVHYGYGITECSPVVSCSASGQKIDGSVGIPDEEYCIASIAKDNEIILKGSGIFQGYWENSKVNDYKSSDGWYHTGDIGYINDIGKLFITGRKKNVLVLESGNNVVPEELELEVEKFEFVNEAMIYIYDSHQSEQLACDVVMNDEFVKVFSQEEQNDYLKKIKDEINKKQPKYKNISMIRMVNTSFVRNKVGKILRFKYITEKGRRIE